MVDGLIFNLLKITHMADKVRYKIVNQNLSHAALTLHHEHHVVSSFLKPAKAH